MKVFGFLESKPCRQAFSAVVLYLTKKFKLLEKTLFVAFVVKLVKKYWAHIECRVNTDITILTDSPSIM